MMRDRTNFTLLLVMPLILVFIINYAIGGLMTEETPKIDATIAILEHTEEKEDINHIKKEIELLSLPDHEKNEMINGLNHFKPIQILKQEVFGNPEIKEMFTIEKINPEELAAAMENDKYTAIIEVPENFTFNVVKYSFLGEGEEPKLDLYLNQNEELASQVVHDLLAGYQEQLQTATVLEQNGLGDLKVSPQDLEGETVTISGVAPITSTTYYIVGMSVMFVLYVASTMGSYAYEEKRDHVFNRMVLANVSKWTYFTGIFIASSITAFLQLVILFSFSIVAFGVSWPSLSPFLATSILLSFAVGGVASLLTSINYQLNSDQASVIFGNAIVTVFAFFGGSFFPIGGDLIDRLGNLTPNGSGMSAFLSAFQGYGLGDITSNLLFLGGFTLLTLSTAVTIFPKRGKAI